MPEALNQRNIFTIRTFQLDEKSLKITVKKPFKYYEEEFSFEDIDNKTFRKKIPTESF